MRMMHHQNATIFLHCTKTSKETEILYMTNTDILRIAMEQSVCLSRKKFSVWSPKSCALASLKKTL
jgi:hypothetical protein